MANEYLDKDGLAYFWGKIKTYVAQHSGGGLTIDDVYPVGSVYMSINSTSPAILFGGEWTQIKDTFLLSAGDTYLGGSTGGSPDAVLPVHSHALDLCTIPSGEHAHELAGTTGSGTAHSHDDGSLVGSTPELKATVSTFVTSGTAMSSYNGGVNTGSGYNYDYLRQAKGGSVGRSTPTISAGKTVTISGSTGSESSHTHKVYGEAKADGTHAHEIAGGTEDAGVSATGANMPPYLAVYVWKRTA